MPKTRIDWIDSLKAIGIFFIVLGHSPGLDNNIRIYVYSFHVPLFFFISGMLFKVDRLLFSFFNYAKLKAWERLFPYFLFGTMTYIPWVLILRNYGENSLIPINPLRPLLGLLYGNGINNWLLHNVVLWFLPCLFITEIFFYLTRKNIYSKKIFIFIIIIFSIIGYIDSKNMQYRLPWGIDVALTALVFYGIGHILKEYILNTNLRKKCAISKNIFFLISTFILGIFVTSQNGLVDMNSNNYGDYLLYYLSSFLNIFFWIQISIYIPKMKWISYIGKNTLQIFTLHRMFFSIITAILVFIFDVGIEVKENYQIFSFIYTILTIYILTILSVKFKKYIHLNLQFNRLFKIFILKKY